jgi:hypothetical protein
LFFSDKYIDKLQEWGWNVVRHPRTGIKPLQLLYRYKEDLTRLGELSGVMIPTGGFSLPSITEEDALDISRERTSELKIGIGLSILAGIISILGGDGNKLKAKYGSSSSLSFGYAGVKEEKISPADLDLYLNNSDINPQSGYIDQLFERDEVYIVTAVLKSKKINVSTKDSKGADIKLELPEIQGVVGANIKVSRESELSSEISYEGEIPHVFGFQVIKLIYENGKYSSFEPPKKNYALRSVGKNLILSESGGYTDLRL